MGPDVGGGGGGAGAQRCAAGAAGCLVGLPHRPLLLEPEAGEEGKVDGEGLAQWGRWGAPGPGGEALGAGREGPGRRKRVEGEGSTELLGPHSGSPSTAILLLPATGGPSRELRRRRACEGARWRGGR